MDRAARDGAAGGQDEDQAARLERFKAAHPGVVILVKGTTPVAHPGGMPVRAPTLRELLDTLEAMYRPVTRGDRA